MLGQREPGLGQFVSRVLRDLGAASFRASVPVCAMGVTVTPELLVGSMCEGLGEGKVRRTEISLIDGFCLLHLTYLRDMFLGLAGQASHLRKLLDPCMTSGCPSEAINACHSRPRIPGKGKSKGPLWHRLIAHRVHLPPSLSGTERIPGRTSEQGL